MREKVYQLRAIGRNMMGIDEVCFSNVVWQNKEEAESLQESFRLKGKNKNLDSVKIDIISLELR